MRSGMEMRRVGADRSSQDAMMDDLRGLLENSEDDSSQAGGSLRRHKRRLQQENNAASPTREALNATKSGDSATRFTDAIKELTILAEDYERGVQDLQALVEAGKIDDETCKMYRRKLLFDFEREKFLRTRLKSSGGGGGGGGGGGVGEYSPLDDLNDKILTEKGVIQPKEQPKPKAKSSFTDNSVVSFFITNVFESGVNAMLQHLHLKKFRTAKRIFKRKLALIGLAFNCTLFALFIYLFVTNYINLHVKQKFVAVDASSGDCSAVPRPYTLPLITADYDGYWLGQYNFDANRNYYQFNLFALALTDVEYKRFMGNMGNAVRAVGQESTKNELAINLLYWHAWFHDEQERSPDGIMFTQTISFAANVIDILNTELISGTVFDELDNCPNSFSYKTYDSGQGVANMEFPMDLFRKSNACRNAIDEVFLGYDPSIDGDRFTLSLDMTTMFSALSVAYDVNGNNTLIRYQFIDYIMERFEFDGNWYTLGRYYDIQNPSMTPMHCVGPVSHAKGDYSQFNCMVPVGTTFGIPLFRHAGMDPDLPRPCNCSSEDGSNDYCDVFDLLGGVMVWGADDDMTNYDKRLRPYLPCLEFFYLPPPVTTSEANEKIFPILFGALYTGSNADSLKLFNNTAWRKKILAFSDTDHYGTASVIAFRFFSEDDKSISQDNTQLENGACNDVMYSPEWSNFYSNPYGKLTENYLQCTRSQNDAVLTSIGVSISTAGSIVGVIFSIVISFAVILADCMKEDSDSTRVGEAPGDGVVDPEFVYYLNVEENQIAYLEKELIKCREEIQEISSLLC